MLRRQLCVAAVALLADLPCLPARAASGMPPATAGDMAGLCIVPGALSDRLDPTARPCKTRGSTDRSGATMVPGAPAVRTGNPSPRAGASMKVDLSWESASAGCAAEGGMWPTVTYTYLCLSKDMLPSTARGGGGGVVEGGPNSTLMVVANAAGTMADSVAVLADCVVKPTAAGSCFGANIIARTEAGLLDTKLVGLEIDIQPASGATVASGGGLFFNAFSTAMPIPAMQVGGLAGGMFANGLVLDHVTGAGLAPITGALPMNALVDGRNGTYAQAAVVLGTGIAHGLNLGGAYGTGAFVHADAAGNLVTRATGPHAHAVQPLGTPVSSKEPCTPGAWQDDENFHYVCVTANTWKRVALSSF